MCPTGLTERFEESRPRLRAVAYRMLGSVDDAEDAVQEAWLRLNRNTGDVDNLDAWLTTVVGRIVGTCCGRDGSDVTTPRTVPGPDHRPTRGFRSGTSGPACRFGRLGAVCVTAQAIEL